MSRIILITGGQRSGKSRRAEAEALRLDAAPVYVATARIFDEEFRERVRRHRERRGPEWTNIERPSGLDGLDLKGRTVLVDCVTLWATNLFFEEGEDVDRAFERFCREFDGLVAHDATYIFVTNEIGLGGVAENAMQRRFTDLQGTVNQYIAARADRVELLVSGIPISIKK